MLQQACLLAARKRQLQLLVLCSAAATRPSLGLAATQHDAPRRAAHPQQRLLLSISCAAADPAHQQQQQQQHDQQQQLVAAGLPPWAGYGVGIERAVTLPAAWYTQPAALQLEKATVLYDTWQMVGSASALPRPGDYACGSIGDVRWLLVRGGDGQLRAFHNVCRHHAAAVATGCGHQPSLTFACPYHNWTYDDKGRLIKATRLKGIEGFKASANGLHPIALDVWGDLVFLHLQGGGGGQQQQQQGVQPAAGSSSSRAAAGAQLQPPPPPRVADWLGASGGPRLAALGMADAGLVHLARREYQLACNWKVFADNYLDGGLHVPYAHAALSAGLDLDGYTNELHERLSIQRCSAKQPSSSSSSGPDGGSSSSGPDGALDRLSGGREPAYAFVFPNLMINRYGPWMDTNVVLPLTGSSVDRCRVVFDYWLDAGALQQAASSSGNNAAAAGSTGSSSRPPPEVLAAALQSDFVRGSMRDSDQVQAEDIQLCEAVQLGLQEPSYGVGRYAPGPEAPMYQFHSLLYEHVLASLPRTAQTQQQLS